jgi:elongation factor 1-gamma
MTALRIFSYLPNPRIWKATIAARLCGVEVEVRGASPGELTQWLWDFDARPIAAVPAETLTAAERTGGSASATALSTRPMPFSKHNPSARSRPPSARMGAPAFSSRTASCAPWLGQDRFPLYGRNAYEASRIDGFLDASLVFARDAQRYLLALRGTVTPEL